MVNAAVRALMFLSMRSSRDLHFALRTLRAGQRGREEREEMKAFVAKDLFHHRVIASLDGAPTHDCLAFKLSRALRKEDSYERTLWGLRAGDGAPRALTSVAFSASYPRWNPDASTLAFLSDRGKGKQVQLLAMHGGEATSLTATKKSLSSIEGWSPGGDRLLVSVTEPCNEDGEPDST